MLQSAAVAPSFIHSAVQPEGGDVHAKEENRIWPAAVIRWIVGCLVNVVVLSWDDALNNAFAMCVRFLCCFSCIKHWLRVPVRHWERVEREAEKPDEGVFHYSITTSLLGWHGTEYSLLQSLVARRRLCLIGFVESIVRWSSVVVVVFRSLCWDGCFPRESDVRWWIRLINKPLNGIIKLIAHVMGRCCWKGLDSTQIPSVVICILCLEEESEDEEDEYSTE